MCASLWLMQLYDKNKTGDSHFFEVTVTCVFIDKIIRLRYPT